MSLTRQEALDLFRSDDLIGIGMAADAMRKKLHPEGVVTYVIDRNINYTNLCTEYCTFCAFYAPVKGPGRAKGYVLDHEVIYDKIRETVELGGTGVLMQGGLNPDLPLEWYEKLHIYYKHKFLVTLEWQVGDKTAQQKKSPPAQLQPQANHFL